MKVSQIFAKATIIVLMILKLDGRMGTYTDLLALHADLDLGMGVKCL
jgi:hypothetical protein